MRFTSIVAGVGLLLTGAAALEKPLNIEVQKAVDCSRKTKEGSHKALSIRHLPTGLTMMI
jgi:hypothetical protein